MAGMQGMQGMDFLKKRRRQRTRAARSLNRSGLGEPPRYLQQARLLIS